MFTPKGFIIRKELENFIRDLQAPYGYKEVWVPHMAKLDLYKKSGHYEKYPEKFIVKSTVGDEFMLKPVNCPHHFEIYASRPRSYRDLPVAYTEFSTTYRDEQSGELNGLLRVRCISVDDCHIICREDQIFEEILKVYQSISGFYEKFNFGVKVRLSLRDPDHMDKYLGDNKVWDMAEELIMKAAENVKEEKFDGKGEAAIYGPKIDFMINDSMGREWQIGTIQLDFIMPERFDLKYIDADGQEKRPVVIHRAIAGSFERFIGILIEQYQGAFPTWLSPVQVQLIPISDKHLDYSNQLADKLKTEGVRVEVDDRSETMQSKIRDAQLQKVPYMVILGDREVEENKISVRKRSGENLNGVEFDQFLSDLKQEIASKA